MSDDLPQRRKSTLEFVSLSIINASENSLLVGSRDLGEEVGEGKQERLLGGRSQNHLEGFSCDSCCSPFLDVFICFSREFPSSFFLPVPNPTLR